MSNFGTLLRIIRKRCIDPDIPGRNLSQERFGELLGRELGILGSFSGAAISELAITTLVILMAWQYRRKGTTVIPAYWWAILLGVIMVCQIIVFFIK